MANFRLASAGDDIKIWDCSGFKPLRQFNPHTNQNVSCLCWSHDNSVIASSSSGGNKISLTHTAEANSAEDMSLGMTTVAEFPTVPLTQESRTCLAFNATSRYIMGGGSDGIIHVWDIKNKNLKKSYRDHKGPVTTLQMNWNDNDVASGSETGEIILYNMVSGLGSIPLTTPRVQAVRQLQYSPFKMSVLGAVSEDGTLNMWDTNRRSLIHSFTDQHKAPATGLVFSQLNAMLMLSVGLDKRIVCYDAQRLELVKTIMAESPLTSIDLMADGSTFVVGSTRGTIFVYDLRQTATPVRKMTAHKSSVQCLRFQNKIQDDVGGVPGRSGSSSRKANANNNVTLSAKAASKKATRSMTRSDCQSDLNGLTSQGLDSRNNNRVETINTNKDTAGYDTVFSPIRETSSSPVGVTSRGASTAGTPRDKAAESSANGSLSKYGDGIFSPLTDTGSFTSRTQYGGGISLQTTPPSLTQKPASGFVSDRYTSAADQSPTASSEDSTTPPAVNSTSLRFVETPHQSDVHHSQSEPVIKAHVGDHVTRSTSSPFTRLNHHTPEDAGATGLPYEQRAKPAPSPVTTPPEATAAAATPLDTSRHWARSRSDMGQGQAGNFQVEMIRSMIDDCLEDFRDKIRRDVLNLHMDMLKQFHIQQTEVRTLLQQYSVNEDLMAEIERLREENDKLKKKF